MEPSNNDLQRLLIKVIENQEKNTFTEEEIKVIKDVIKDRQAIGRVFSWILYVVGAISSLIVGWSIITGKFFEWIKQGVS